MGFERTITELADLVGFNLYYIFNFFANIINGYVLIMIVFTLVFLIIMFFRFAKKNVSQ